MNMKKVVLVVGVLFGGVVGGIVLADVLGVENSLQRVGVVIGYTILGALSLAFWVAIGIAFYRWLRS